MKKQRMAAAEALIAAGLHGTNWGGNDDADNLRRVAEVASFHVRWPHGERGGVELHLEEKRGALRIRVSADIRKCSPWEAIVAGDLVRRVATIADDVEKAIEAAVG